MASTRTILGIGVGFMGVRAEVLRWTPRTALPNLTKSSDGVVIEVEKLTKATLNLENQYLAKSKSTKDLQLGEILSAQAAMASDPELLESALTFALDGWDAQSALQLAMQEFKDLLEGVGDEFQARIADLDEITYRLVKWIDHQSDETELPSEGSYIIVADELTPMDTITFTDVVVGVITRGGGPTSHTAIVCRSRGIPALVACQESTTLVNGTMVVIDPQNSRAIINGTIDLVESTKWWERLGIKNELTTGLMANVGSIIEAEQGAKLHAAGIGLLRTELFFLNRRYAPSFQEQVDLYSEVFAVAPDGQIIVRTLDAGSDKPIPFLGLEHEENPALGVRGQRVASIVPDFYDDQLKAIKAASDAVISKGKSMSISVMAPMIATVAEAREFANKAREIGFKEIGIMIEVPSITYELKALAGFVDFVSIGTNDLSQYLFAADRLNSKVAHLLSPWQPILLSLIAHITQDAHKVGIKVGVCGESASDPLLAACLAGVGVDSVSASLSSLVDVGSLLSRCTIELATKAAHAAMNSLTPELARINARAVFN